MSQPTVYTLKRRDIELGHVSSTQLNQTSETTTSWPDGRPMVLNALKAEELSAAEGEIDQSKRLYHAILEGQSALDWLEQPKLKCQWDMQFESFGTSVNPHAAQEIETLFFDAITHNSDIGPAIEDLWLKISWLSFCDTDASIRFRFSFGVDFEEDVAADKERQRYAAKLADAVFPESCLITHNAPLISSLRQLLNHDSLQFVERIVYFNAPNGGAYLHHDLERGHAGVVYLQVSGQTVWLALPKLELIAQIKLFIHMAQANSQWPAKVSNTAQKHLIDLTQRPDALINALESFNDDALIQLINETPEFIQSLFQAGHGYHLSPGMAIVLPQETHPAQQTDQDEPAEEGLQNCCWHSVFSVSPAAGQGLSFAIRKD